MNSDVETILFDEQQIAGRVSELGALLTNDYKGKKLLCIGILNGSAVFMSDLVRKIDLPLKEKLISENVYSR